MGQPRQLVIRVLLQQEGFSHLGAEVRAMDGLDPKLGKTGWRNVDVGVPDRASIAANSDHRSDNREMRKS